MKKIIILGILLALGAVSLSAQTNDSGNLNEYVEAGKQSINLWKSVVADVKTNGFSFGWLVSMLIVLLGSLTILAKLTVWLTILLEKFVPDNIDAKLFKVRSGINLALGWFAKITGWLSATNTKKKES